MSSNAPDEENLGRSVGINSEVYGSEDGKVAFLDAPEGVMPPPKIGHLIYLGPAYDVVTLAVKRLHAEAEEKRQRLRAEGESAGRLPSAQRALSTLLGVGSQQVVSRWVNAEAAPRLTDDQWAKLVRLVLAPAGSAGEWENGAA